LECLKLFAIGDVTNIIDAVTVAVINAIMRINQLPFSATRWQHGIPEMICNFYLVKNANLVIAQLPLKLDKKWHTFTIFRSLEVFNVCLTKFKRNQLLNKTSDRLLVTTKLVFTRSSIPIVVLLVARSKINAAIIASNASYHLGFNKMI
jgi:hypothetical protein